MEKEDKLRDLNIDKYYLSMEKALYDGIYKIL